MSNNREYEVHIVETLEKVVYVEAESRRDAVRKAEQAWKNGDYITHLDADDFMDVDFVPYTKDLFPEPENTKFYLDDGKTETDNRRAAAIAVCTTEMQWGGYGKLQGGDSDSGIENTQRAIASLGKVDGTIWKYCQDMREATGDISWYVPSLDELGHFLFPDTFLKKNKHGIGEFWTSEEELQLPPEYCAIFGPNCPADNAKSMTYGGTIHEISKDAYKYVVLFRASKLGCSDQSQKEDV